MRRPVLLLAPIPLLLALARAADDPAPTLSLSVGDELVSRLSLAVSASMRGPDSAPLRLLGDDATIRATLRWRVVSAGADGSRTLEGTPEALEIRRRFQLKASGLIGEDSRDELGHAAWRKGDRGPPPPPWRVVLDARGRVHESEASLAAVAGLAREAGAGTAEVSSATPAGARLLAARLHAIRSARWALDGWLHPLDADQPDDAKLRRAGRWLELGPGFLGAPALPGPGAATTSQELGQASLTNALVDGVLRYDLARAPGDGPPRFVGKLASLGIEGGQGPEGTRRPDRWLEVARRDGALGAATGELEARLDPARGVFDRVRSTVSLEVRARYGDGRRMFDGVARLDRRLQVEIEPVVSGPGRR